MPYRRRQLLILGLMAPWAARAQVQLEGFTFERSVSLDGVDLVLNGTGLRAVAWFKGYAAALYLPAKATTPAQVLAQAGPKRLQMRLLQDVPAAEFVKAIDKGFARNTPEAEQGALAARREAFDRLVGAVGKVVKGDVVDLDYVPARGLVFALNGKARGEPVPGADFYAALLRIFIGDKPVDARLKSGLLGGAAA